MPLYVTEDEAQKKWCPFVRLSAIKGYNGPDDDKDRLVHSGSPSYNRQFIQDFPISQDLESGGRHTRLNAVPSSCLCVASACMAWRWTRTNIDDGEGGTKPSTDTYGYCGLAGVPTYSDI